MEVEVNEELDHAQRGLSVVLERKIVKALEDRKIPVTTEKVVRDKLTYIIVNGMFAVLRKSKFTTRLHRCKVTNGTPIIQPDSKKFQRIKFH
jgi:hypothetical protein